MILVHTRIFHQQLLSNSYLIKSITVGNNLLRKFMIGMQVLNQSKHSQLTYPKYRFQFIEVNQWISKAKLTFTIAVIDYFAKRNFTWVCMEGRDVLPSYNTVLFTDGSKVACGVETGAPSDTRNAAMVLSSRIRWDIPSRRRYWKPVDNWGLLRAQAQHSLTDKTELKLCIHWRHPPGWWYRGVLNWSLVGAIALPIATVKSIIY